MTCPLCGWTECLCLADAEAEARAEDRAEDARAYAEWEGERGADYAWDPVGEVER